MGLEILSQRDLQKAKEQIKERWLEILFRLAATRHYELRERAKRVLKTYWHQEASDLLEFLGDPYGLIFRGLLLNFIQCYDPQLKESPLSLRDFKNLEEVERAERAVLQIERAMNMLSRKFPDLTSQLKEEDFEKESPLTLIALLGTCFAFFVLKGQVSLSSLTAHGVTDFLKKGFEHKGKRRFLKSEWKEKFITDFVPTEDVEILRPLWGVVFQELEDEFGGISNPDDLDFRFVQGLWIQDHRKSKK